ncbi:MAG: hypothetical protein A2Y58_03655 [Chloroflexi bacterium RBG_13_51_52]|nr:MAG: hypothetical protein A2Y58_03655 [Chloroflexi bacterium RBG_13_51_52]
MPVDWELTATTIYCDDVADEVTIIVNQDGTVKCTGSQKYISPSKEVAKELKTASKKLGKKLACKDPACSTLDKYREELMAKK